MKVDSGEALRPAILHKAVFRGLSGLRSQRSTRFCGKVQIADGCQEHLVRDKKSSTPQLPDPLEAASQFLPQLH